MVDPDAPTVVGVVVTVTVKGARLWTYVCTSAWTAGDSAGTAVDRRPPRPFLRKIRDHVVSPDTDPEDDCPEEGHEKHCRRQCELDKVFSPVVAHAPAPAGLR